MVTCPKCGYDNELGRIFCHSCGTKLDLTEIKSPSQGGKSLRKKKAGSPIGRLVRRTVEIAIPAALVIAIYLALQVPGIRPISTTNDDLISADRKRAELDDLATQKQPRAIRISEAELNAFIETLGFEKGEARTFEVIPTRLQFELGDGVVTAIFVGKVHLGGSVDKQLYLSYTGAPAIEGGTFVFKAVGGSLGALPISPWILEKTGMFDRYYGKVFLRLDHERQVLNSLSSISVTPKEVVLHYQPR
jgi:hypothetical protein